MQKTRVNLGEIKLVGIKVRTNNQNELNQLSAKISPCVQRYFHQQLFEKIPNRKNPETTFSAYTEYESDYTGEYTYFIGEEVTSIDHMPEELATLIVPPQNYVKFTTESGPMPDIVVQAWQKIWQMSSQTLGGTRHYHTDFELYDERAMNHQKVILDVYIGIATNHFFFLEQKK